MGLSLLTPLAPFLCAVWLAFTANAALPPAIYPHPPDLATDAPALVRLAWSPGDYELIVNGDFETGNFAGWGRVNTGPSGNNTFINSGGYQPLSGDGPFPPFAGSYSTVTDQNGPGNITLFQDITIPATADVVTLTWVDRVRNHFNTFVATPPLQEYRVEIRGSNNTVLATLYRTEPGEPTLNNWIKRSFDLTDFKGQRVRLAFSSDQNWNFFNVHLDNVSVRVRSAAPFTYDVYFGTNAAPGTNEFLGRTSVPSFELPALQPGQTYYWQILTRHGGDQTFGPVWRFATRPVGAVDHFLWDAIDSPQQAGAPIAVKLTAVDAGRAVVTNFSGTVTLSGADAGDPARYNLLGDAAPAAFATYDRVTVGYAFTVQADLRVTYLRSYAGGRVSLWTEDGLLLVSREVLGAAAGWNETPLDTPVQLLAGKRYRLGWYAAGPATRQARFDLPSHFAHGVIEQSYEGLGDGFPTRRHPARWWLVDLGYTVAVSQPVPITPAIASNFVNGVWSGVISVAGEASRFVLRAQNDSGQVGLSEPFSVLSLDGDGDGMPDDWELAYAFDPANPNDASGDADGDGSSNWHEYHAGTNPRDARSALRILRIGLADTGVRIWFQSGLGRRYVLERADSLAASSWEGVGDFLGDGSVITASDAVLGEVEKRFYRFRALPP